jgi:hypothetical protein
MTDVILSSEDLTILGGPESITLDLDFGPQGERGSEFFVGNGNPNSNPENIPVTPKVFDMYINLLPSDPDEEYLYLYQYQNVSGEDTWTPLVKLIPNTYSTNRVVTFVDGEKSINVQVSKLVPPSLISSITSDKFNVQYSISGSLNPVSSSISVLSIITESVTGDLVLPMQIKAVEYNAGSWSNLSSEVTVHLLITVV